jgi:hypothetical protein
MSYEFVGYEQDGRVVTITFDRPERMNAIGPVMSAELVDAWTRFRDDDGALVAVLTGRGGDAFCAGADLKDAAGLAPVTPDEQAAHARGERPGIIGPGDRRGRGTSDRAGQRGGPGRAGAYPRTRARAGDRAAPPARDPHRQGGGRAGLRPAV